MTEKSLILKEVLAGLERYKNFTIMDTPQPFNEFAFNKDIDVVQVHSADIYDVDDHKDIIGFCGQFSWKNNELTSLDHDSYNKKTIVLGYSWWSKKDIPVGLDILVGDDW